MEYEEYALELGQFGDAELDTMAEKALYFGFVETE